MGGSSNSYEFCRTTYILYHIYIAFSDKFFKLFFKFAGARFAACGFFRFLPLSPGGSFLPFVRAPPGFPLAETSQSFRTATSFARKRGGRGAFRMPTDRIDKKEKRDLQKEGLYGIILEKDGGKSNVQY